MNDYTPPLGLILSITALIMAIVVPLFLLWEMGNKKDE